jgi:hypothetical protein
MSVNKTLLVLVVCMTVAAGAQAAAQQPAASPGQATKPTAQSHPLVVLRLANNTLLVGHIIKEDTDTIVFDAGALGQLTVKRADVVAQLDPAVVAAALQTPSAPAAASGVGDFAAKGKVTWNRAAAFTGYYTSPPYIQGELDPKYPGLTGKVLRLPGVIYQVQGQVQLSRSTDQGMVFFDASTTYAYADNIGAQVNSPKIVGGYNFKISKSGRVYGVARHTYSRDTIKHIVFSNQTLAGVGMKVFDTAKVHMDLVPGVSMQYDRKGTPFDNRALYGGGVYEVLDLMIGPFSKIEQHELYYQAVNETKYYGLESYIGFKGMVTKVVGVTAGFTHTIDNAISLRPTPIPANALFPGQPAISVLANKRTTSAVTMGVLVKF